MRIAMDVEGVLADIVGTWIYVYNYDFKKEDILDYSFRNLTPKYGVDLGRFLSESRFLWMMEIVREEEKGIGKIIKENMGEYKYDIESGRNMPAEIEEFLKEFKIPYGGIITGEFNLLNFSKAALGYDVYIDDHPYLHKSLKPHQYQIMRSQPWNRLVHHKQVIRAECMEEVFFRLERLEGDITRDKLGIQTR